MGASLRDRAGRASPEPASGLGHSATIPCACAAEIERLRIELARATGRQRIALIDQDGKEVGYGFSAYRDLLREDVFVDDAGTVWTRPTAWAYFAACRALRAAQGIAAPTGDETETGSTEGKSPVGNADAPKGDRA
jgi:hypothetical protein